MKRVNENLIRCCVPLYCNDGCTQPLQYAEMKNGKYKIVLFEVLGMGMTGGECKQFIDEEYDEIVSTEYDFNVDRIFVCVRKGNLWGMFRYSSDPDRDFHTPLLGCVFEMVEDVKWHSCEEMLAKWLSI